jgi:hypothetical protein
MTLAAALIYWLIISLWLAVPATVGVAYVRNPRTFGTVRLLLAVLVIDTIRNIAENLYFGLYKLLFPRSARRFPQLEYVLLRVLRLHHGQDKLHLGRRRGTEPEIVGVSRRLFLGTGRLQFQQF